jgi:hypothetical protein
VRPGGLFKPAAGAFVIALAIYALFYHGIEHRRTRKGPWQVAFTEHSGLPALEINQPALGLTNVQIVFAKAAGATDSAIVTDFSQPRAVPYDVPYGTCIFMDTTFLPGTLVFDLFGHEIQLLPRVLTIDKREQPWQSGTTITLMPVATPPGTNAALPAR